MERNASERAVSVKPPRIRQYVLGGIGLGINCIVKKVRVPFACASVIDLSAQLCNRSTRATLSGIEEHDYGISGQHQHRSAND